jgi:hypothetical protein
MSQLTFMIWSSMRNTGERRLYPFIVYVGGTTRSPSSIGQALKAT